MLILNFFEKLNPTTSMSVISRSDPLTAASILIWPAFNSFSGFNQRNSISLSQTVKCAGVSVPSWDPFDYSLPLASPLMKKTGPPSRHPDTIPPDEDKSYHFTAHFYSTIACHRLVTFNYYMITGPNSQGNIMGCNRSLFWKGKMEIRCIKLMPLPFLQYGASEALWK